MADFDFDQIRALIDSDALEEARDKLVDILYADYDNLQAWLLLTECAYDQDEYKRAVREALRIQPDNPIARRLALNLAQQADPSGEGQQRQKTNTALQSLANFLILLLVIIIGASIVFVFIGLPSSSSNNNNVPVTTSLNQECAASIERTLRRLEARCGLLEPNSACLANPSVTFERNDGLAAPQLAGDKVRIDQLSAIETGNFSSGSDKWGLVIAQPTENVQLIITHGVRISNFDTEFQKFNFRSSPLTSECEALPPSGILLSTIGQSTQITLNDLPITLNGTIFTQVDAAAGLRIFVLDGTVTIQNNIFNTSESIHFDVTPLLLVESPLDFDTEEVVLRGKLDGLMALLDYQENIAIAVAQDVTPTVSQTPTIENTTQIITTTPTKRATSTPRPTQTPTSTQLPTSTDIPIGFSTHTPIPTATILESTIEAPNTTFEAQVWNCRFLINDVIFEYQIIFESSTDQSINATALLPSYGNTVVLLEGELYQSASELSSDWVRIPSYLEGEQWLLLREQEILYSTAPDSYSIDGIFRFVLQSDGIVGGVFENSRLIGIVQQCLVQN